MRAASVLQPSVPYRPRPSAPYVEPDPFCIPTCYCTGAARNLDVHHVFHGPYRDRSDEMGCWVYLRHEVHMALHAHASPWFDLDRSLKERCQEALEERGMTREEFIRAFGRSYII